MAGALGKGRGRGKRPEAKELLRVQSLDHDITLTDDESDSNDESTPGASLNVTLSSQKIYPQSHFSV